MRAAGAVLRSLARQPRQMVILAVLSLLAFGLEDIAAYYGAGSKVATDQPRQEPGQKK